MLMRNLQQLYNITNDPYNLLGFVWFTATARSQPRYLWYVPAEWAEQVSKPPLLAPSDGTGLHILEYFN